MVAVNRKVLITAVVFLLLSAAMGGWYFYAKPQVDTSRPLFFNGLEWIIPDNENRPNTPTIWQFGGVNGLARERIATTSLVIGGAADPNITIKVQISTDNGVTWAYRTEAQTAADNDGNWTTTVTLTEGDVTGIRVRAVDENDNVSLPTSTQYVLADVHSPTLTITSPAVGTNTENENIEVMGTVTRDVWETCDDLTLTIGFGTDNVVEVPISPDFPEGSFTHTISLEEGTNTITVSVTDGVNTPATYSFVVTRTVPNEGILIISVVAGIAAIAVVFGVLLVIKKR